MAISLFPVVDCCCDQDPRCPRRCCVHMTITSTCTSLSSTAASTVTTNAPPSISDSLPPPPLSAATARCSSQSPYHGDCTEAQARPRFSAVRGDAGGLTAPPSASILPRIALPVRAPLPAPLCAAHHVPPLRAAPAARIAPALPTLPPLTPLKPLTPAGRLE